MNTHKAARRHLLASLTVAVAAMSSPSFAQAPVQLDLPRQSLELSLRAIGSTAGVSIAFEPRVVRGRIAPKLAGAYSPDEALAFLTRESGLGFIALGGQSYLVTDAAGKSALRRTSTVDRIAAQESQAPEVNAPTGVEEIIVTARKRQESILKSPVVQSVLTQAMIERAQVTTLTDIAAQTPGIVLGTGAGDSGALISLRGVGTSITDPGIDQSVSLNLDGLQVTQGAAYSVGVFDMTQVEVLKGPQALFFGKASSGGVISIRTADPGPTAEVIGRLGYEAEAREWRAEAIASGPISDSVGLRLSALYSDSDGFFKNTAVALPATGAVQPSSRFGASENLLVRGTAVFRPNESFNARLKLNYSRSRQTGGAPQQVASCPDGPSAYAGVPAQFFSPNDDCKLDRNLNIVNMNPDFYSGLPNNGVPFTNITQKFGVLEWNYEIQPSLTLTSVTGFYQIDVAALYNGTLTGASAPALAADKDFRRKEFTQEIRLNSDFRGPANFTAGGFYQNGKLRSALRVAGNRYFNAPPLILFVGNDLDIETVSLFGQLRYNLASDLELSGGARWTDEKRTDIPRTISGGITYLPTVPRLSSRNWAPELTLSYTPTDDLTIFGSLKQAYKSGSYNLTVAVLPGTDNSFGDERVRGGEVGLKSRLADRQVDLNLAAYHYAYRGLQTGAISSQAGGIPIFRVQNAGGSKIYGVDFDMTYRPMAFSGLTLRSAVNWNHARFSSFGNAQCWGGQTIAEGCDQAFNATTGRFTAQDLKGARIPRAPDWQINFGGDYETPVSRDMNLSLGLSGQYTSKYATILGRRDDFVQKGATKINARVALSGRDDAWEVALIGNNLLNTLRGGYCSALNYAGGQFFPGVVTGAVAKGASGSDDVQCSIEQGRQLWIRFTVRGPR